jgi:DNA polymerase III alpha subunit
MIDDFIGSKHGKKAIRKLHPLVDDVLAPTYGVPVYQEQVMQIAQQLAGYTLGGADLLRRAMGKKKGEEMQKQEQLFVEGASGRGVAPAQSLAIFKEIEGFASYGFNKSHSAAYALVTYQTAYLKEHYPTEFFAATLSADKDKIDKVVRTIAEARAWGVSVLPPDINASETDFSVVYAHQDGVLIRRSDSDASVDHLHTHPLACSHRHGAQGDGSSLRELHRIRQQVEQHLTQTPCVGPEPRNGWIDHQDELQVLLSRERPHGL